jgi:hypothetical protein
MSSGPRKFSEKIALLNQKQAEQNAAFNLILSEVKSIVNYLFKSNYFYYNLSILLLSSDQHNKIC